MKTIFVRVFMLCALIAGTIQSSAQDSGSKPNVFIDYFSYPSNINAHLIENLRNNAIEGIQALNRINLIDVDSNSALQLEASRRNQENISAGDDMERLAVMTQEGANYLIQGRVASIDINKNKNSDGSIYYTAIVNLTVKVINPNDGKLEGSKTFDIGSGLSETNSGSTPDEAVLTCNKNAKKRIREIIEDVFRIKGTIIELDEVKKDEAKSVYISIGSANGVGSDSEFEVAISREIAGRKSLKTVGDLKVKKVEGDDLTLCTVKKGGKEIYEAFKSGQELVVTSKVKKGGLFGTGL